MNQGKLYVPKRSKLYITAVILAFAYVLVRIITSLACFGSIPSFMFTYVSTSPYLGYIQLLFELCIPIGFILSRKDIRFASLGNIAILIFVLVCILNTIILSCTSDSGYALNHIILLLIPIPIVFIIFPLHIASYLYIFISARSKIAFTIITTLSATLYSLGNYYYTLKYSLGITYISQLTNLISPIISTFLIFAAYISFNSSLQKSPCHAE